MLAKGSNNLRSGARALRIQARMQRECEMGCCACGPKGTAARCVDFEQSTSNKGKSVNDPRPTK
eukprot:5332506-Pleurochrysis_carterae.AAC.2